MEVLARFDSLLFVSLKTSPTGKASKISPTVKAFKVGPTVKAFDKAFTETPHVNT